MSCLVDNGERRGVPRFRTDVRVGKGIASDSNRPGRYLRPVCCAGCQDLGSDCERLMLEFLPVVTNDNKYTKVFLVVYKFLLRGEQMVALLHHSGYGKYSFQKTDGTISKMLALDSTHRCLDLSTSRKSEESSDTSSLTQFDCVEDEPTADVRNQIGSCNPRLLINNRTANHLACLYDPVKTIHHHNNNQSKLQDHRHKLHPYHRNRHRSPSREVML